MNIVSFWNLIIYFCAGWNVILILIASGITIGQAGTPVKEKVHSLDGAFFLLLTLGIPSFLVAGRIFGWW
jgi:hypothetical protein